jgi:hypothetical protein
MRHILVRCVGDTPVSFRRTPKWRTTAHGILFRHGDIVENGERSEEAAREGLYLELPEKVGFGRIDRYADPASVGLQSRTRPGIPSGGQFVSPNRPEGDGPLESASKSITDDR